MTRISIGIGAPAKGSSMTSPYPERPVDNNSVARDRRTGSRKNRVEVSRALRSSMPEEKFKARPQPIPLDLMMPELDGVMKLAANPRP
jgi:hypothetical protein